MEDARISQLNVAAALSGSEYIPITQLKKSTNVLRTVYTNPDAFKNFVFDAASNSFCPTGLIVSYAGNLSAADALEGWLLCDGRSVLKSTYSKLFDSIGNTYGASSNTTFKLPNLRGRVVMGYCDTAASASLSGISINPNCGDNIANALRFRSSAAAAFSRTPGVVGNRGTWTWSSWLKRSTLGSLQTLFGSGITTAGGPSIDFFTGIVFTPEDKIGMYWGTTGTGGTYVASTAVFKDVSKWYHVVVVASLTNVTVYVNNTPVISVPISSLGAINSTAKHTIGATWDTFYSTYIRHFDGVLAEVNFIDGQALLPAAFAKTNACNAWVPDTYTGTYGINGFYLNFANRSAMTASTIGDDASINNNQWTPINMIIDDAIDLASAQSDTTYPTVSMGSTGGEFNHQLIAAELPLQQVPIEIGTINPIIKPLYNSGVVYSGVTVSMGAQVSGGLKALFGGTVPSYITFSYGFGQSCGYVTNKGTWQSLGCSGNNSSLGGTVTVAPDANGDVYFRVTDQGWGGQGLNVSIYLPGNSTRVAKQAGDASALPFNVTQPYMVMNYIIKY